MCKKNMIGVLFAVSSIFVAASGYAATASPYYSLGLVPKNLSPDAVAKYDACANHSEEWLDEDTKALLMNTCVNPKKLSPEIVQSIIGGVNNAYNQCMKDSNGLSVIQLICVKQKVDGSTKESALQIDQSSSWNGIELDISHSTSN